MFQKRRLKNKNLNNCNEIPLCVMRENGTFVLVGGGGAGQLQFFKKECWKKE